MLACISDVNTSFLNVIKPKRATELMGYFAYVSDTENNVLRLWEDAQTQ